MRLLTKIIEKVTTTAKKAILFGALVGGVSMLSHATETTVGPTIEKAQLETVNINLEAVVAAITKADPSWVKKLPVVKENVRQSAFIYYTGNTDDDGEYELPSNWSTNPNDADCGGSELLCEVEYDSSVYNSREEFLQANNTRALIQANALDFSLKDAQ